MLAAPNDALRRPLVVNVEFLWIAYLDTYFHGCTVSYGHIRIFKAKLNLMDQERVLPTRIYIKLKLHYPDSIEGDRNCFISSDLYLEHDLNHTLACWSLSARPAFVERRCTNSTATLPMRWQYRDACARLEERSR